MRYLVLAATLVTGSAAKAATITAEEYAIWVDWRDGREDPRLEKDSEAIRKKKIAAQLGVNVKALEAAIGKVEPVAGTIVKETEQAIRATLDGTPLKGKILDVSIDDSQSHVVAYVKWRCGDVRDIDKEASWAGWAVGDAGKLAKTIGVWCVNDGNTKIFSAKLATSAAAKIGKSSIERFAGSRYIKLFEDVKRGPHE